MRSQLKDPEPNVLIVSTSLFGTMNRLCNSSKLWLEEELNEEEQELDDEKDEDELENEEEDDELELENELLEDEKDEDDEHELELELEQTKNSMLVIWPTGASFSFIRHISRLFDQSMLASSDPPFGTSRLAITLRPVSTSGRVQFPPRL